jgi:hypothetical protein
MKNKDLIEILRTMDGEAKVFIAALTSVGIANSFELEAAATRKDGNIIVGYDEEPHRAILDSQVTPAEAVFAFSAWLSARPKMTVFSASTEATEAAELAGAFCHMQDFKIPTSTFSEKMKTYRNVHIVGLEPLLRCGSCGGHVNAVIHDVKDLITLHHDWIIKDGEPLCATCQGIQY